MKTNQPECEFVTIVPDGIFSCHADATVFNSDLLEFRCDDHDPEKQAALALTDFYTVPSYVSRFVGQRHF